jgi:hypothetical protein
MHVEWVDDEAVVLDPESGQLHYLNPPAALVYAFIQEHGYEAGLAELDKLHGKDPGFAEQLPALLEDMVNKGLLVES